MGDDEKRCLVLCHERSDACTLRRYVLSSAFGMYSMHGVERLWLWGMMTSKHPRVCRKRASSAYYCPTPLH